MEPLPERGDRRRSEALRVLITGADGFVGRYLTAELRAAGWEVWGMVRAPVDLGDLPVVVADLEDRASLGRAVREVHPQALVHLAAQTHVPTAFRDPEGTYRVNVLGQLRLLEEVRRLDPPPRTLIVSSAEVYGPVRPEELPLSEDAPLRPANPYAVTKAAQDLMGLQYFLSYRLPVIRARPFNHLGPGQRPDFVASAFARQVAEAELGLRDPVVRVGNLEARRDFTDVRDVVRAYRLLLEKGEPGEVYNVGSGRSHSIRWILETLIRLARVEVRVEVDPELLRPVDVPDKVCDARRLRERTGWSPQIPLERTLEEMLDWWRRRLAVDP